MTVVCRHRRHAGAAATTARGFTLIEVLIALSLISLLMLTLTSAIGGMGRTEEGMERRIASGEDWMLSRALLRQTLGTVSGRAFRPENMDIGRSVAFFFGSAEELRWNGVMPARYGVGGRHYLRLAAEPGADGAPLWTLRYAPFTGADTFENWDSAHAQVLTTQPMRIALSYLDGVSGQWLDQWPPPEGGLLEVPGRRPQRLPEAVRVDFDGAAPPWPPMLLAVHATWASRGSGGGGSFGGMAEE